MALLIFISLGQRVRSQGSHLYNNVNMVFAHYLENSLIQSFNMERLICLIVLFFCSLSSNGMSFCTNDMSSCTKSRSLSTFKRLLWWNCKSWCTFWGCPAENIYRYWPKTSGEVHFTDRYAQPISCCGLKASCCVQFTGRYAWIICRYGKKTGTFYRSLCSNDKLLWTKCKLFVQFTGGYAWKICRYGQMTSRCV